MTNETHHNLRSRNNNINSKEKVNKKSALQTKKSTIGQLPTTTATLSQSSATTTASSNRLSSSNKLSTVNACRLSTSVSRLSIPTVQNPNLSDTVRSLESRLTTLEALVSQLTTENTDLRNTVANLQVEVTQCRDHVEQHRTSVTASENNISLEQQDLNTNIVIRGVDVKEDTPESELLAVYEGIRSHLNISNATDLAPVSVTALSSNPTKSNASYRPIRVQLPSVAAKVKFLQIRRVKKDILHSDIGINNVSRRPILISEQLTRHNQELLFQARSLRGQDNFKFVWSTNGQILARHRQNTKVIRIIDTAHINRLRTELNLEALPEHGRRYTPTTSQLDSNNS